MAMGSLFLWANRIQLNYRATLLRVPRGFPLQPTALRAINQNIDLNPPAPMHANDVSMSYSIRMHRGRRIEGGDCDRNLCQREYNFHHVFIKIILSLFSAFQHGLTFL